MFHYLSKTKLSTLPKAPGVYALSSPKTVLYIGKAQNLRDRVKNHFQQPSYRDHLFSKEVTKVGYLKTDSDIDALLLESQLIKQQQPKYNVMWKDDKKYFYVAITKERFPRVFLTHQPVLQKKAGEAQYIGPFVEGKAIKRVMRLLRRVFPYYTAKKHGVSRCTYCHLNLCPGPTPDLKAYKKNIQNLLSVLKGKRTSVIKQLGKEMKTASKKQDFEKAARARDQLLSLERIVSHSQLLSSHVTETINWNLIERELQKLFSTKRKITRIEAYDISNTQGNESTGSQVVFLKGIPAKESYRKYKIHITGKPNDFAMIKELVSRRLQHKEWVSPQIMVIDGGKGQLNSAGAALREAETKNIFLVALAKQQSELFFPGKPKSILLQDLPKPVEHMFLHIRDEAHRFAISYHRLLRAKKILKPN